MLIGRVRQIQMTKLPVQRKVASGCQQMTIIQHPRSILTGQFHCSEKVLNITLLKAIVTTRGRKNNLKYTV